MRVQMGCPLSGTAAFFIYLFYYLLSAIAMPLWNKTMLRAAAVGLDMAITRSTAFCGNMSNLPMRIPVAIIFALEKS